MAEAGGSLRAARFLFINNGICCRIKRNRQCSKERGLHMKIINAQVYDPEEGFVKRDVCTNGSVFAGENGDGEVTDAKGMYLIPGLTDIHFHGCMGHDFCEGNTDVIQLMADYEENQGITTMCPATMTMSPETLLSISRAAKAFPNEHGAALVGINMEGPFIAMEKKGAQNPKYIHVPDLEMFDAMQEAAGGLYKLIDIAPEVPGAMEFIEKAKGRAVLSVAHTNADYDTAKEAFEKGATHVTHLYNAMNPIHHRKPGPIIAAADTDFVEVEIICDNIHLHPAIVRNTFRMFGEDRIIMISDTMEAVGMPDGEYELGGQAVTKRGNRATLADGTIAGSATNLMDCMRTAVKAMNIPLEAAVRCAAVNPARSIGIYDHYGSIAEGKYANCVLLDQDLEIQGVFNRGIRVR